MLDYVRLGMTSEIIIGGLVVRHRCAREGGEGG
jgi:hypothetical protein